MFNLSPARILNYVTRHARTYLFCRNHPVQATVIHKVSDNNLTYLDTCALVELSQVVLDNERKGIDGAIIEAGCALGGSSIVLASSKERATPLCVYDVFGMIPSPSEKDGEDVHRRYEEIRSGLASGIKRQRYYGYEESLYDKVIQTFVAFGMEPIEHSIKLIKGLYEESLIVDFPVSLAHIDCDWYESVLTCLTAIEPHLVPDGTLVIDDYFAWSGCRRAVDEYFHNKDSNQYLFMKRSRLHIVKRA